MRCTLTPPVRTTTQKYLWKTSSRTKILNTYSIRRSTDGMQIQWKTNQMFDLGEKRNTGGEAVN